LLFQLYRYGFENLWGFDPFLDDDLNAGPIQLRQRELTESDGPFDLVMFNHSLEHMRDPREVLAVARKVLKLDGVVLVRIPVAGTYAWRRYGTDWVGLDPPRHLVIPSRGGVQKLAEHADLKVVRTFYDSYSLQFWGSEQYRRGIPLRSPQAVGGGSRGVFSRRALRAWRRQSRRLNQHADGDFGGFILRPAGR
jgi:SAM-dependent methyltransferase